MNTDQTFLNKTKFTRKYKNKLLQFAELATPLAKVDYLNNDYEFDLEFSKYYPRYRQYLVVTNQRARLMEEVNEQVEVLKEVLEDPATNELPKDELKALQNKNKKYNKILRRLKRKLKYRLRENYYDNTLVNDWIKCYNIIGAQRKEEAKEKILSLMDIKQDDYEIIEKIFNDAITVDQAIDKVHKVCSSNILNQINIYKYSAAPASRCYLDLISAQADFIIIRQINRKRFHQFSTAMDDLYQELRIACLTSLPKFNPALGKPGRESFNWFSHICLKAGHMITLRKSDRDKLESPDSDTVLETLDNNNHSIEDRELYVENEGDPLSNFYKYFFELFNGRERMQLLLQILIDYVLNASYFTFKKNEFVKYCKSFGFTPAYVNKFLNIIKSHKGNFQKDQDFELGF